MKHIIPFTLPAGTQEAYIIITKPTGSLHAAIQVRSRGLDTVSINMDDLQPGIYTCRLIVGAYEVYKRELVV